MYNDLLSPWYAGKTPNPPMPTKNVEEALKTIGNNDTKIDNKEEYEQFWSLQAGKYPKDPFFAGKWSVQDHQYANYLLDCYKKEHPQEFKETEDKGLPTFKEFVSEFKRWLGF